MTKSELIEEMVRRYSHYERHEVEIMVNTVFATLTEALRRGERIDVRGFGTFQVKTRQAREGRNPRTGAPVALAAKRVPFFKAGKELRQRLNEPSARTEQDREKSGKP